MTAVDDDASKISSAASEGLVGCCVSAAMI